MTRRDVLVLLVVVFAVAGIVVFGWYQLFPDCGFCDEAGSSVSGAPVGP